MKKLTILSLTLVLASCAVTPQKLRTSKPVLEQESGKSPEHVAVCIADGWENIDYIIYSPVVSYRPSTSGVEVVQYVNGVLTHLADIESVPDGSNACFGLIRTPIPVLSDRTFRFKPISHFALIRSILT